MSGNGIRLRRTFRPTLFVRLTLALGTLAASGARAQDATIQTRPAADHETDWGVSAGYRFSGPAAWENVVSQLVVDRRTTLWKDPAGEHRALFRWQARVGSTGGVDNAAELARSLLLPGALSTAVGVSHQRHSPRGIRVECPVANVAMKLVRGEAGASARQLGASGGAALYVRDLLGVSLQVGRAVNALGERNRMQVLTALSGGALWSTYTATAVAAHVRPGDLYLTGTFGAFLGDSKFAVPPRGRRIYTVGVAKSFRL